LNKLTAESQREALKKTFDQLSRQERESIKAYLGSNSTRLAKKFNLTMTPSRMDIIALYYSRHITDIGKAVQQIKSYYDEVKRIELYFFKNHDINIVLEEEAIDFIIERLVRCDIHLDAFYKQLNLNFEHGLKLVREKTGRNRFFITRDALLGPENFIRNLLSTELPAQ